MSCSTLSAQVAVSSVILAEAVSRMLGGSVGSGVDFCTVFRFGGGVEHLRDRKSFVQ